MVDNREPGEETIGNATRTYIANRGRFATETGHKDIIEQGRKQEGKARQQKTGSKAKSKDHRVLGTALVASLATGAVATGIEATLHPVQKIIQEVKAEYKVGEVLNPTKIFEVKLVNSFDNQGQLVEPHALVTIDGQVRSVSLDDPNLSDVFRQDSFRGFTVIGQGEYRLGNVTNPDFKKNLAAAFNLPKDIGEHFNRLGVGEGLSPRAVYFQPVGGFYTENGRQFQAILPLNAVQLSGSTGS